MNESATKPTPIERHWERARRHLALGRLEPARALFEGMCGIDRDDVRTHLLGAEVAWQSNRIRRAADHARLAARAQTDDPTLICGVIDGLLQTGEHVLARTCLERPALAQTDSASLLMRRAGYRQRLGEHEAALQLLERIRAIGGDTPDSHYYRGQQLIFNGHLEAAEVELDTCLQARPEHGRAAQILSRLRQQTPERNHLSRLNEGLQRVTLGSSDHAALEFALYKELEDLGRWQEAWDALVRGNRVMSKRNRVETTRFGVFLEQLVTCCASGFPVRASGNAIHPQPIFVIGLPRSGSTVLERMLGNHPDISAAGELQDFGKQLHWVADTHNLFHSEFLRGLENLDAATLGNRYLEQTRWRAQGRRFFVDKQLSNWMLVGLIRAALPHARILHVVRDAMDVCFSNWRAYFGDTQSYSYDLASLEAYYQSYASAMAGWHRAFPGEMLDVSYSELIEVPQETMRKVLGFCGLPNAPECADIAGNTSPVATLSSTDVRDGLHKVTRPKWLPYAAQLAGLRKALGRSRTAEPAMRTET